MRPLAATVPSSVDSAPTGTSRAFKRMRRVQALPDVPAAAAIPDDALHRQTCTHYLQGVALDPEGEALAYFKRDKHGKTAASDAEMHIVLPLVRKYMCIPGSNHRVVKSRLGILESIKGVRAYSALKQKDTIQSEGGKGRRAGQKKRSSFLFNPKTKILPCTEPEDQTPESQRPKSKGC